MKKVYKLTFEMQIPDYDDRGIMEKMNLLLLDMMAGIGKFVADSMAEYLPKNLLKVVSLEEVE